ncbi:hypothetical protein ACFDAU_01605 [Sulfuriferula sp. GW1]|uniref:hypothetical protein n=1 Tax=Sulfuriferula sp. GW1 TaxID=3345111 RepID=UPI0039B02AAC
MNESLNSIADDQRVFRDEIKEHRGNYYVSYRPADARFPFAIVQLTFLDHDFDRAIVKNAMENELQSWLSRFRVPVMVSSFDAKDDLIHISTESDQSNLMGYVDLHTGEMTQRWGLLKDDELPSEQMNADYLARVYEGVPFRLQEAVRQNALRDTRTMGRSIRMIVFLLAGVPLLIEIVSVGVAWVGYVLAGISITVGLYKLAKTMGWLKPTQREKERTEKDLRMKHYFYHCEQNPDGFNRLKFENFEREAISQNHIEADQIRNKHEK